MTTKILSAFALLSVCAASSSAATFEFTGSGVYGVAYPSFDGWSPSSNVNWTLDVDAVVDDAALTIEFTRFGITIPEQTVVSTGTYFVDGGFETRLITTTIAFDAISATAAFPALSLTCTTPPVCNIPGFALGSIVAATTISGSYSIESAGETASGSFDFGSPTGINFGARQRLDVGDFPNSLLLLGSAGPGSYFDLSPGGQIFSGQVDGVSLSVDMDFYRLMPQGGSNVALSMVPEPTTGILLATGIFGLAVRRRSQH